MAFPPKCLRTHSAALPSAASGKIIKLAAVCTIAGASFMLSGYVASVPPVKSLGRASATPNPFAGEKLFVDPSSNARRQADLWRTARPQDADAMDRIAKQPKATWIGDWNSNVKAAVDDVVTGATRLGALPVLVAYNIPARDCGMYSAGGARNGAAYKRWVRDFAAGLKGRAAVVVLEPDALAARCLSTQAENDRLNQIRDAVTTLGQAGAAVYIDAGNPTLQSPNLIADRLRRAGIAQASGFSLNVANFYTSAHNVSYGAEVSRLVGGKHFIVDTGRNGNGSGGDEWCNPQGRALGEKPTVETGSALVDAFLWIKSPGESDGSCNGAPAAGKWWAEYALGLAQRQKATLAAAN